MNARRNLIVGVREYIEHEIDDVREQVKDLGLERGAQIVLDWEDGTSQAFDDVEQLLEYLKPAQDALYEALDDLDGHAMMDEDT